jgi:ferredoxin
VVKLTIFFYYCSIENQLMNTLLLVLCLLGGIGIFFFFPFKGARSFQLDRPVKRIHEADVVLSRRLLVPGTEAYDSYYKLYPEFLESDEKSRNAPGLLDHRARYFHTGTFAAARSNFELIEYLGALTHGIGGKISGLPESNDRIPLKVNPDKTSRFIKQWLVMTGAHSVGFTRLEDYHLYSHKGRGPRSGSPIRMRHEHAIAITVEMDHRMMQSAPQGSTVMESSEQYLRSGVQALKLAAWIRELGYEATAHIDGNYELICPLVAADAGLGTIGRMGLLMTPRLGPRVRISVVSTNLPLSHGTVIPDRTTLHFCHLCKKCARVCPSSAIPEGNRKIIDGAQRWQIDSERCYHYWVSSGTDCGRCISTCPYGHPDNGFHRFIRWGIKNNLHFRRLAIKLDDLFYGKKPAIKDMPDWSDILD